MKKQIEILIKWLVPIFVIVIIYIQIKSELTSISSVIRNIDLTLSSFYIITSLSILMIVNWFCEAVKWKLLINKISIVSYKNAFYAILNGLAFGLFTPFRVGDVITRIAHIDSESKTRALGSVLIARSSQLVTTIIFGCLGLIFFPGLYIPSFILIFLTLISLIFFYRLDIIVNILRKIKFTNNYIKYIEVLNDYNFKDYTISLMISISRYLVIIFQYYLMFKFFNITISAESVIVGVSITLFIKSILPLVSVLGDFGIRELVAIYIFGSYGIMSIEVLLVTISIWLLNVILPSLIGSFLSKNFKLN